MHLTLERIQNPEARGQKGFVFNVYSRKDNRVQNPEARLDSISLYILT
jgi:hypothetical protein